MNSVVSLQRPSAGDVRPGTELYEKIILALRGEYHWKRTHDTREVGNRCTALQESSSNAAAHSSKVTAKESFSTPLNPSYLENMSNIETLSSTPLVKRACHVHNGGRQVTAVERFTAEVPGINNTKTISMETSNEENLAVASTSGSLLGHNNQTVQCSLAQKLQKISQLEKTSTTKAKPPAKYKPPYKFERSSKPDSSMKNLKQTMICCDPSSGKMTYRLNHYTSDNQCSTQQPVAQARLQKIASMTDEELTAVELLLDTAEEVACSLCFSNGSWQLREPDVVKISSKRFEPGEIDGICISVLLKKNPTVEHLLIPLDSSQSVLHSWARRILCTMMANEKCQKVCYGGQEITEVLYKHFDLSLEDCLQWRLLDIQVGCWLLDPDHPPHSYAECCKFLSIDYPADDRDIDKEQLLCTDMLTLVPAMSTLSDRLRGSELWQLYCELEVKIIPLLAVMQNTGIHLDTNKLLEYSDLIKTRMTAIETEAHKLAGHSFLLTSTYQLRQVLFNELALHEKCQRSLSKTASQKFTSTSEHVLTQLQDVHPLPGLILEYRHFAKTKSTYIDGILPYISDEGILKPFWYGNLYIVLMSRVDEGRVHTGTATGRLVSINPNIQAFPKQPINLGAAKASITPGRDDSNVEIFVREAVESRKGHSFLSADFKSIELRVLAHFSNDDGLLKVLHESDHSKDVFISLACYWLCVKADQVTNAEREKTKRVVYAVVYGVGKDKLADILNIHPSHAKELMESFLAQFPGVQVFIQNTIATCRKQGYVTTLMNRRRYFPSINHNNFMNRSHAERQAVNFVIQGSAADICKTAMLKVMETLTQFTSQARLLLQIHDELLFEIPTRDLQQLTDVIHMSLESHKAMITVPLYVRISTGQTWASLQSLN